MKHLRLTLLLSMFLLVIFSFIPAVQAAKVKKVTGKKVVIELEELSVAEGENYFILDPESEKKIGIIEIKLIKGKKALGILTKGKAIEGGAVVESGDSASSSGGSKSSSSSGRRRPGKGVLVGLVNSTMFIKDGTGENNLKGTGYALTGFYDVQPAKKFNLRFAAGLETINAKGGQNANGTEGSVSINYLSLGGVAQMKLTQSASPFWLGLGGAYLLPMSNASSKIKDASGNYYFSVAAGMDIQAGRNFIPLHFEYGLFPPSKSTSSEVTLSAMIVRVGFGF